MLTTLVLASLISAAGATNYTTPTKKLTPAEYPVFSDDIDFAGIEVAIQRQLDLWTKTGLSGTISLGGTKYSLSKAKTSLQAFKQLVDQYTLCRKTQSSAECAGNLNRSIQAKFNVFAPDLVKGDPRYGEAKDSLFTGYATQPITGSATPDDVNTHAIYAYPKTAADRKQTRDAIDFHGALAGKGLELGYAPNLFDLYLLHIEGGGFVTLPNNVSFYLSYDGENRQPFAWISKYMLSKGYISNLSTGAQRKYLRTHPEKWEEIYSQCPSYVFFKVTTEPPNGVEGIPVTPGRSVATDDKLFGFKGLLTFVMSQRPVDTGVYDLEQEDPSLIPMQDFSRFFLDQDTGGAITGKGRADIYFGQDDYAQYAATYQQDTGNIYFLLLK